MAKLVCPSGHQEVTVPGDGKDFTGVCDVCGRPMRVNQENHPDLSFTDPNSRRDVIDSRKLLQEQQAPAPKEA